jgi:hypothetical protein
MKVEPINFYEMMRASHVKRWHIINTSKEQNLAEHQWNVTVIGLQLNKLFGKNTSELIVLSLMFHDIAEIRYGDIPTPGKAFIRKMLGDFDGDFFDHMDAATVPEIPYSQHIIDNRSYAKSLCKMADMIEAAWWLRENGQGHHAAVVAEKLWRAVVDYTGRLGWHDAVNSVLQSLGMPYIGKDMIDNPP